MGIFRKSKNSEDKTATENSGPQDFQERIALLLMVCIEGIGKLVPEKDTLSVNLKNLGDVMKKATRLKPVSGLAKEIEEFFTQQNRDIGFRKTKNQTLKQIVSDLTTTLKEITSTAGNFDNTMELTIDEIQKASDIEDILGLKDKTIEEIENVRAISRSIKKELDAYRRTTRSLSSTEEQSEARILVDPLTNVLNRNSYNMKISQMIREYSKWGDGFCLIVIDIDHFQKFNDQFGHKAGDRVLKSIADSIKDNLRSSDLVYRHGGEEFVVIFDGGELEHGVNLAERIRQGVEKDYLIDNEQKIIVTISLGIACVHEGDTELSLFERADKALFTAKQKGRNQVEAAES